MRSFPSDSRHEEIHAAPLGATDWTQRTEADFNTLLLELARAQRGFRFYGEADPRRRTLADRAHRALIGEITRGGPVELSLEGRLFRLGSGPVCVESAGALIELEEAFRIHGVEKLRLDLSLTGTALAGLLDQLAHPARRHPSANDFAQMLAARDAQGIQINDLDSDTRETRIRLTATPPRVAASLATPETPSTRLLTDPPAPPPPEDEPKPRLEADPLAAPAHDDRGERLRARLIELNATTDDAEYRKRVADIVAWAEDLWNEEAFDDYYRTLLVVADHAVGSGGRSEVQARAAAASYASLANGDRLGDLIRRAIAPTDIDAGAGSVRAAQLLLQLGAIAVPAIFDQICSEVDPNRSEPLRALILTQGEVALPTLIRAIKSQDVERARQAIRLAGELQNPLALPTLLETLKVPDLSRRIETIRALSLLPGEKSKRALTEALSSDLEEIASAASEALARADGGECVPALLDVLEASIQTTRTQLGSTLINVLGRTGDERAVPRLCSILERRPVLRRAHWHAIQLATVEALAILPTKEARRSLERAALHAPVPIRDRARTLLESHPEPKRRIAPTSG